MSQLYDSIGKSYVRYRRPDPRIAAAITSALGGAKRIVNIGAGAGSYEPGDREVIAVEPSEIMIRQRPALAAPVVRASAMALPFRNGAFDAALAILTIHHWADQRAGLSEMARVAKRCVILTWEPFATRSWLTRDYFPEILDHDRKAFPSVLDFYGPTFSRLETRAIPIPHDCTDGFLEAYWRRPQAYLDPDARMAISSFAYILNVEDRLSQLRRDLDDGTWARRNGHLLDKTELDLGCRLVIGERR
jgi:SAM-dependent methyltransferase